MEGTTVSIKGRDYLYVTDVASQPAAWGAFNRLARRVFDLDFEPWRVAGGLNDRYRPHLLMAGDDAVANVSVNLMDFTQRQEVGGEGQARRYVQLGTVMTAPEYRGQGLARWLMGQVLARWAHQCDGIYLYANDKVLDFYPRFGFAPLEQPYCVRPVPQHLPLATPCRRLDMADVADRTLLLEAYTRGNPYSAFEMIGNTGLLLFHALNEYRHSFYHLEVYDAVVAAVHQQELLLCLDVYGGRTPMLDNLTAPLLRAETREVAFGFLPLYTSEEELHTLRQQDSTLMLRGGDEFLQKQKLLFPLLSQA